VTSTGKRAPEEGAEAAWADGRASRNIETRAVKKDRKRECSCRRRGRVISGGGTRGLKIDAKTELILDKGRDIMAQDRRGRGPGLPSGLFLISDILRSRNIPV